MDLAWTIMGSCTGKRCHCGNTYTMNPLFHILVIDDEILTGKGKTVDRIIGLEKLGADDHLAKLEGVGTCSNP